MSQRKDRNATLVGFFLFIGLSCLGIMIAQFSNISGKFNGDYIIQLTFSDASGLVGDSDVTYGGAKVGRVVSKPKMQPDQRVLVDVSIKGDVKIPKGSKFAIYSVSLLGDKAVSVDSSEGVTTEFYQDGDSADGESGGGLDGVASQAEVIANNANEAITDFRNMAAKLNQSVEGFDVLVAELNTSLKRINTSVLTVENTQALTVAMENIKQGSEAMKKIQPLIAKFDPMVTEARATLKTVTNATLTAESTFAKASQQIDNLGPSLAELPETLKNFKIASAKATGMMSKVEGIANETQQVIAKVNRGDGVLSSLTGDTKLKEDTQEFVKNLKKYGILRYRDIPTEAEEDPKNTRFRGSRR